MPITETSSRHPAPNPLENRLYARMETADRLVAGQARYFSIDESRFEPFLESLPRMAPKDLLNEREHLFTDPLSGHAHP